MVRKQRKCPNCGSVSVYLINAKHSKSRVPDEWVDIPHRRCRMCKTRFDIHRIPSQAIAAPAKKRKQGNPYHTVSSRYNIFDEGGVGVNCFCHVRVSTHTGSIVVEDGILFGGKGANGRARGEYLGRRVEV